MLWIVFLNVVNVKADNTTMTPNQYRLYLKNYTEKKALKACVDSKYVKQAVNDSKKVLKSFNKLTLKAQKKLLNNFNKPIMLTKNTDSTDITPTLSNFNQKMQLTKAGPVRRSISTTWHAKGFLPSMISFRMKLNYKVRGKKIKCTTSIEAYLAKNYNKVQYDHLA